MPYTRNPFRIAAVTQALQNIPQNQKDTAEAYLMRMINRPDSVYQTMRLTLTSQFPEASLLLEDSAVRSDRQKLSADAWKAMLHEVTTHAVIDRPAGVSHDISMLFRPEVDANSKKYNDYLRAEIEENNFSALAGYYQDHLQQLEDYDAEELENLTDADLVSKFPHLYALYTVALDAGHLLDPQNTDGIGPHLSGETKERLQKLAADLPLFAALMARFESICHPYYADVDTDGLMQEDDIASKVSHLDKESVDAQFFAQMQQRADRAFDLQLSRQLQRNNIDISTVKIYDLEQKEYALNGSAHRSCNQARHQGKALIFRDAQGHVMALRPEKGQFVESHAQSLVDSASYAFFTTEMDQLMELATGSTSNPFWMLTGSSQYRDLKTALMQHAQVVKAMGYPQKTESLETLDTSLQQLSKAASEYLKYKDPTITEDMTFQRYLQENEKARNMNAREKARLEAAFQARDLAPRTRHVVSLSREIGARNQPVVSADHVFYQGLLRKYNTMEKQLDSFLANPDRKNVAQRINEALSDPRFHNNKNRNRPENMDDVDTLLWEMQRMTELIDATESLMGLNLQDRILDQKEAARMRSSKKFGEQDPAALSVEELQNQMAAKLWDAAQERANTYKPSPRPVQPEQAESPKQEEPPKKTNEPKPVESAKWQNLPELMDMLQMQDLLSQQDMPQTDEPEPEQTQQPPQEETVPPVTEEAPSDEHKDDPSGDSDNGQIGDDEAVQSDAPRTLDYKPLEFFYTTEMIQSGIARSNSSAEVEAFLKDHADDSSSLEKHLEHRAKGLMRIEKLEANNTSHRPTSSYTAMRNDQPVEGEPVLGDTIMLPGVYAKRRQSSTNGCWSVSLSSQLAYRGVDLIQEEIRTYRPSEFEGADTLTSYCENNPQSISDYAGLVSRVLPNSALFQYTFYPGDADREVALARMKHMLFQILTKENSPVSICRLGHYVTVVGMDGDHVFLKDPLAPKGDPEFIEKKPISSLLSSYVELNWVSDLTPSLGGSIEPDTSWCTSGIFYGNGRAYSSIREEASDPLKPEERVVKSHFSWEFPGAAPDGSTLKCPATVMQPIHLKYTRLPGSNYNADALKTMQQQLQTLRQQHPGAVDAVLKTAQNLQQGAYKANPDEGMLTLAGKYMAALKQLKEQNDPGLQPLQEVLTDHLSKIRTAVMDMQTAQYKHLIGPPSQYMAHGNEEKCPEGYNQEIYNTHRKAYFDLQEGFAGMVYFHTVNTFALDDDRWLTCLNTQAVKASIATIKDSAGFQNMIKDMYDQTAKFDYYTGSGFKDLKAFLDQKAYGRAYDENQMLIKNIPDPPGLTNITKEEAKQKMSELMEQRNQFFLSNGINPEYYKGMPKEYDSQRTEIEYRFKCFADLRASARSGNTAPLYQRCLQHIQKAAGKQLQGNQPKQLENAVAQQEAQAQAGMINI